MQTEKGFLQHRILAYARIALDVENLYITVKKICNAAGFSLHKTVLGIPLNESVFTPTIKIK